MSSGSVASIANQQYHAAADKALGAGSRGNRANHAVILTIMQRHSSINFLTKRWLPGCSNVQQALRYDASDRIDVTAGPAVQRHCSAKSFEQAPSMNPYRASSSLRWNINLPYRAGGRPAVQRHSSAKSFDQQVPPYPYTASSAGGSDSAPSTPVVTPALDASPSDPVSAMEKYVQRPTISMHRQEHRQQRIGAIHTGGDAAAKSNFLGCAASAWSSVRLQCSIARFNTAGHVLFGKLSTHRALPRRQKQPTS